MASTHVSEVTVESEGAEDSDDVAPNLGAEEEALLHAAPK